MHAGAEVIDRARVPGRSDPLAAAQRMLHACCAYAIARCGDGRARAAWRGGVRCGGRARCAHVCMSCADPARSPWRDGTPVFCPGGLLLSHCSSAPPRRSRRAAAAPLLQMLLAQQRWRQRQQSRHPSPLLLPPLSRVGGGLGCRSRTRGARQTAAVI